MKAYPTTVERLGEITSRMEIMTTDGDKSQLTQDDIGDIYTWLLWAQCKTSDKSSAKEPIGSSNAGCNPCLSNES